MNKLLFYSGLGFFLFEGLIGVSIFLSGLDISSLKIIGIGFINLVALSLLLVGATEK